MTFWPPASVTGLPSASSFATFVVFGVTCSVCCRPSRSTTNGIFSPPCARMTRVASRLLFTFCPATEMMTSSSFNPLEAAGASCPAGHF